MLIAVIPAAMLFFSGQIKFTTAHLAGLLFGAWCLATLSWTDTPLDSQGAAAKLILLGTVFCLGSILKDLRPVMTGFALGLMISSVIVLAQVSGYRFLPEVESPSGLFVNRNFLAEAAALCIVGCVAYRLWWCIAGLLPSIILTGARGAVLGLTCALVLWGWQRARRATIVSLVVLLAAVAIVTAYRGEGLRTQSIEGRFALWSDAYEGLTLAGRGIGSFYGTYPAFAQRTDAMASRPDHMHNDALEILYETGPVGLSLAILFVATLLPGPLNAGRLVLIAFLVIGCFGFPLGMPGSAFLGVLCAGHVAGARCRLRDEAWFGRIFARQRTYGGLVGAGGAYGDQRSG